ncbi:cation:proton antiporter domain-containing protein [Derxia lacustris]|uniref:cation:proton antiporter domain-containing protein n=1 Tax=Derxia lacustris TaxID=764842 RepID=UPI000A16DB8C|nr:cation:proton antiporter [Derxia lacustris]
MPDHPTLGYLRETLLFLALAGVLIPLLQRWRVNQTLGFIATGVLVGPHGLGLWADAQPWLAALTFPHPEAVASLAELGVLFLMFMIGLELSAERLWSLRRWVFGAGSAQVLASATVIGGLAFAFGNSPRVALLLGCTLALSSTAVVMQWMSERRTLATPLGQAGFSILMLQDLAVVPLLILVGVLADAAGAVPDLGASLASLGMALLRSALAIAAFALLGRRVLRPVLRHFAQQRAPDAFMALILLVTLGSAALTGALGLSLALGAFLAGLLLAETEFRHEVEVTVEPFKGLLMGLFFMSVGMGIDLGALARDPLWLPLSVLGLFAIKAAVVALVLRAGGLDWGRAAEGGLLLGQGGEFAFIVIGDALARGLIDAGLSQFMLLVVSLSLFATPFAARLGERLAQALDARAGARQPAATVDAAPPGALAGHVVIAGHGRIGQLVARLLTERDVPWTAVESDARRAAADHAAGLPVYYGNAARPELLRKLEAARATAIVITMDQPAAALHAVRAMRAACPHVPIYARSHDAEHARELRRAGATAVVPEALEAGLQIAARVLDTLGLGEAETTLVIARERERQMAALDG